jgi:hypothetical protein
MTRNEMITEKMGWDSDSQGLHVLETWDEQPEYNKLYLVKLLQQRMVDDGWSVEIWQHGDSPFPFKAKALSDNNVIRVYGKTEPAAIVELFCTVYGIKEDGE